LQLEKRGVTNQGVHAR